MKKFVYGMMRVVLTVPVGAIFVCTIIVSVLIGILLFVPIGVYKLYKGSSADFDVTDVAFYVVGSKHLDWMDTVWNWLMDLGN